VALFLLLIASETIQYQFAEMKAVAEMGDRLATIGMGRKWGGLLWGAGSPLGPHLTQCGLGRGLPLYQVAS